MISTHQTTNGITTFTQSRIRRTELIGGKGDLMTYMIGQSHWGLGLKKPAVRVWLT